GSPGNEGAGPSDRSEDAAKSTPVERSKSMRYRPCNRRHNLQAMTSAVWLHLLFFCSGVSGLIYQVVWVRQFGQVYGNTVYSASIVVAIFMLGLGAGAYLFGVLADRSRLRLAASARRAAGLIRLYAGLEVLIGVFGAAIS